MKKRVLLMGLAAVMVMGAVVGGSLAAGQASAENPVTAPLAAATLNIEWTGSSEAKDFVVEDKVLMPGDEVTLENGLYSVTNPNSGSNSSSVDAYIRVTVTKYWADDVAGEIKRTNLGAANIGLNVNEDDWIKATSLFGSPSGETEVYYYKYPVPVGQSTSALINGISIPESLNNDYVNKTVMLKAVADGVQFAGADATELNENGILASWGVKAEMDANGNLISVTE